MKTEEFKGVAILQKTKSKAGVWCTILKVTAGTHFGDMICINYKEAKQKAKALNLKIIK